VDLPLQFHSPCGTAHHSYPAARAEIEAFNANQHSLYLFRTKHAVIDQFLETVA
jgi:hypothetical protein